MKLRPVIFLTTILLFPLSMAHPDIRFSGASYNETSLINNNGTISYGNRSDLRVKAVGLSEGAKLVAELDFYTLYGYLSSLSSEVNDAERAATSRALKDGQFYVDRLYMKFPASRADVILGKQRIAWGSGVIFSPTDNFNRPNPLSLSGRREGVNALVAKVSMGSLSAVDLVIAPADVFERTNGEANLERLKYGKFASRFTLNKFNTDMALSYQYDGGMRSHIYGLDVKGDAKLGYHLETIFVHGGNALGTGDVGDYWRSVLGLDYSFQGKWVLLGEYFYNGSGRANKTTLPATDFSLLDAFGYRHYLYSQISYQHDIFFGASLFFLRNMVDGSFILSPSMNYSIFQNTRLDLYVQAFSGDGTAEYSPERLGSDQVYYLRLTVKF